MSSSITKYINDSYGGAKAITFDQASIVIKKSAQVRLKNEKPTNYYEIGSSAISSEDDLTIDDLNKCIKANIGSLDNQKLEVGDVLITMRAEFKYAKVVTKKLFSHGLPVVAIKGQIIFRTKDIEKAKFLKFYLERDEIRSYINNHEDAKVKVKVGKKDKYKYNIETKIIQNILLPDTINGNLSLFLENSSKIMQVVEKGNEFVNRLKLFSNRQRENFCKKDLQDTATYSDIKLWEKLRDELQGMIDATSIEDSK